MSFPGLRRLCLSALLLVPLAACNDAPGPIDPILDESELTFVRVAPGAPELADTMVSFWAVPDEHREVQIRYVGEGYEGKCLRFSVPAGAIHGDSVQITIRVVDRSIFSFQFDPEGVTFDPAHPALLEVRYRWADADFNGDGVVDQRDEDIAARFGFWRQEHPGGPWHSVETTRDEANLEATAKVYGFTRYALATS